MSWAKRPEKDTPQMETRAFTDDQGRRWVGSVISGRFAGGERNAEIIFVCEDQPGEAKRYTRLDRAPVDAANEWRSMDESQMQALFRDSEEA
jgi:hypothetical protein